MAILKLLFLLFTLKTNNYAKNRCSANFGRTKKSLS